MKKEEYKGYTIIHINYPTEEEVDQMIENINNLFAEKYGKIKEGN